MSQIGTRQDITLYFSDKANIGECAELQNQTCPDGADQHKPTPVRVSLHSHGWRDRENVCLPAIPWCGGTERTCVSLQSHGWRDSENVCLPAISWCGGTERTCILQADRPQGESEGLAYARAGSPSKLIRCREECDAAGAAFTERSVGNRMSHFLLAVRVQRQCK